MVISSMHDISALYHHIQSRFARCRNSFLTAASSPLRRPMMCVLTSSNLLDNITISHKQSKRNSNSYDYNVYRPVCFKLSAIQCLLVLLLPSSPIGLSH